MVQFKLMLCASIFVCSLAFKANLPLSRFTRDSKHSLTMNNHDAIMQSIDFLPLQLTDLVNTISTSNSLMISDGDSGYSGLSLYFTLALYILTLPGLYSLVTRSVKVKPTQRVYDLPGPANPTARPLRQTAAEIMAYFKALNYEVTTAEDVITFRGVMGRSNSQAAFLTFCTFIGLGSLGLVLSILLPDVGAKAYAITLLSPYAGIYYWNNAQREDTVSIKMETSDDDQFTNIIAQGGKEDLERFSKALNLPEKGKVYVKGLFEGDTPSAPVTPSVSDEIQENSEVSKNEVKSE